MTLRLSLGIALMALATAPAATAATYYHLSVSGAIGIEEAFVPIAPADRLQPEVTTEVFGSAFAAGGGTASYDPPGESSIAETALSFDATVRGGHLSAATVTLLLEPIPFLFGADSQVSLPGERIPPGYDDNLRVASIDLNASGFLDLRSDPGTWAGGSIWLRVFDSWTLNPLGEPHPAYELVREEVDGVEQLRARMASRSIGLIASCGSSAAGRFTVDERMELLYGPGDEGRFQLALFVSGASFGASCGPGGPVHWDLGGAFEDMERLGLVPLPGSGVLLLGALGALALRRRRRG